MAGKLVAVADVVSLVVTMRGEDGQDGGVGGGDKFDPVARRHVQALSRRRERPFPLGFSVISGDAERAPHRDQELMAGLVRMSTPGDPGAEIEEVKFSAHLERQLLPGFYEREGAALITSRR